MSGEERYIDEVAPDPWRDPESCTADAIVRRTLVEATSAAAVQHDRFTAAFCGADGKMLSPEDVDYHGPAMASYLAGIDRMCLLTMVHQLFQSAIDGEDRTPDELATEVSWMVFSGEQGEYLWDRCAVLGIDAERLAAEARSALAEVSR